MIHERKMLWRDVGLGIQAANDIDVVVMPDCEPILVVIGDLLQENVLVAIDEGDARIIWWREYNQILIGVKIYGETIGVSAFAVVSDPDWRLGLVLGESPMIDVLLIDGTKEIESLDRDRDVQYFYLHNV